MKILFFIPARGGSKGVPGKNIKLLNGKPLIQYSIDIARHLTSSEHICVSTDSTEIAAVVKSNGLDVPFLRPPALATDTAGTYEVIMHALDFYEQKGAFYDIVVVLQPTSPFRTAQQVSSALELYTDNIDMVTSVKETSSNPYYVLFEEDSNGYLAKSKEGNFVRRQDCPPVWELNGSIYIINVSSLKKGPVHSFKKIVKYEMSEKTSVDIDTPLDWLWAEFLIKNGDDL